MKNVVLAALALLSGFGFAACDVAPEDDSAGDAETTIDVEADNLDEEVVVTRVELTTSGYGNVGQWTVTRRAQLAETALEDGAVTGNGDLVAAQQSVSSRTSGCLTTDLRLWTDANYTGDQICFYGAGAAHIELDDYAYGSPPFFAQWGGAVSSVKPGGHSMHFDINKCGPDCTNITTNISNYTGYSEWLWYNNSCPPC